MGAPKTGKRPLGGLFVTLGTICIFVAILFFLTYAITRANTLRLEQEGMKATAQIEELHWSTGRPRTYYAYYRYIDRQGKPQHSNDAYPFADWESLKVGQPLEIVYFASFPDHSRIARRQAMMVAQLNESPWLLIGGIALMGVLAIAVGVQKHNRRNDTQT